MENMIKNSQMLTAVQALTASYVASPSVMVIEGGELARLRGTGLSSAGVAFGASTRNATQHHSEPHHRCQM